MNHDDVNMLFRYEDGALYWKVDRGSNAKAGFRAGRKLPTGYRSVHVSGRRYQEHRLIYLLHHGEMPVQIDHINGVKDDNRVENLRPATHSQNQVNTADRTDFRGIRLVKKTGRWMARIYKDGKELRVGTYATECEAREAYRKRAQELFGVFVR